MISAYHVTSLRGVVGHLRSKEFYFLDQISREWQDFHRRYGRKRSRVYNRKKDGWSRVFKALRGIWGSAHSNTLAPSQGNPDSESGLFFSPICSNIIAE